MSRFSSRELFELRNNIPIDVLIRDHLKIPSKISDGLFRFLCPLCNEFQTAVNPATNLARCFRCEKNFNTIDLVMQVRGYGFKDSVSFLKELNATLRSLPDLIAGIGRTMS
jgi:DNA primase